jgi:hypothetical protein
MCMHARTQIRYKQGGVMAVDCGIPTHRTNRLSADTSDGKNSVMRVLGACAWR